MALTVTHPFVSGIADGPDATQVRPSNWNANHSIAGIVANQIVFGNGSAILTQSANLSWDDTITTLSTAPGKTLNIHGSIDTVFGGGLILDGGDATATTGQSEGGPITISGGNGYTKGGEILIFSGQTFTDGPGAPVTIVAADGVGLNQDGGNVSIRVGNSTGSGVAGYLAVSDNFGLYGIATGTGTITRGNIGPGTTALSVTRWLPILVDGQLKYIELYS